MYGDILLESLLAASLSRKKLSPIEVSFSTLQVRTLKARDERLKRMSDLLSSIRLVKMYAWEGVYREKVEKARDAEMSPMFRINLLDGIIDSLYSATSSVVSVQIAYLST